MKKLFLMACILTPLILVEASIISSIAKRVGDVSESGTKQMDEFAPVSIDDMPKPESQILSEAVPTSQRLSGLPSLSKSMTNGSYKLTPEAMPEAEALVKSGQGTLLKESDGSLYFIPNPVNPIINLLESEKIEEKEEINNREPISWTTRLILFVAGGLLLCWIYNWFKQVILSLRQLVCWLGRVPEKISRWLQR